MDINTELKKVFQWTQKDEYQKALDVCSAVITKYPKDSRGYGRRSYVYACMKDWENAISDASTAIDLNPNDEPSVYFQRARWYLESNDCQKAIEDLNKTIEIEESHGGIYFLESAYFFRAVANSILGNFQQVLRDCSHVRDDFLVYIFGNTPHSKKGLVELSNKRLKKL